MDRLGHERACARRRADCPHSEEPVDAADPGLEELTLILGLGTLKLAIDPWAIDQSNLEEPNRAP